MQLLTQLFTVAYSKCCPSSTHDLFKYLVPPTQKTPGQGLQRQQPTCPQYCCLLAWKRVFPGCTPSSSAHVINWTLGQGMVPELQRYTDLRGQRCGDRGKPLQRAADRGPASRCHGAAATSSAQTGSAVL